METRTYDVVTGYEDTRTLPHGTTLTYTRDAAGRELERSGTDGSLRTTTYGPSDRMETITDDTSTTTYGYDAPGRWTGLAYPTGGTWERAHDAADRVTSVTTTAPGAAASHETQYVYDDANRLIRVIDPLGGNTVFTYDAAGRLDTRTLPNGVTTTWTYDVRSRVDTITHRRADTTIITSVDYERTDSGEPTRIGREDGSYVILGYDAALRLTSEAHHDAADTLVETITYSYDRDGNRTSRTTSAGEETYAYASGSRLTGITRGGTDLATYTYDGAGRVTTRRYDTRDQTLSWDADDHVVALSEGTTELAYDFDPAGRRVRREERVAGAVVDVDRWQVAPTGVDELESPHLETDDTGAEQRAWVFAGEHPLLRYDPATGDVVYYLADAMGSVIGLVDDTGAAGTVQYDGFGNERVVSGTLAAVEEEGDFRFQGMWLDGDSGLYYVRARVYEPGTGRFLSRDPAEGVRTGADTYWTYAFAADNPYANIDPTGRYTLGQLMAAEIVGNVRLGLANGVLGNIGLDQCGTIDGPEFAYRIFEGTFFGLLSGILGGGVAYSAYRGSASLLVALVTSGVAQGILDIFYQLWQESRYEENDGRIDGWELMALIGGLLLGTVSGGVGGGVAEVAASPLAGTLVASAIELAVLSIPSRVLDTGGCE